MTSSGFTWFHLNLGNQAWHLNPGSQGKMPRQDLLTVFQYISWCFCCLKMGLSGHTHGYPNISWFIMVYHHLPSENGFLKMAISQYASIPIFMQAHDTICHPWYPLVVAFDLGLATAGFPNSKVGRRQL